MSEQHSAKDLGKNKLTLSEVLPLSVLIPPSWSSSNVQSPPSQISTNSTNSLPTLSFDQLSLYAKKISNSTLNPFTSPSSSSSSTKTAKDAEQRKKAFRIKAEQASNGFLQMFLLSLNDSSLKLYIVSDHIQRKVPRIVELKKRVQQLSNKVETANLDVEDIQKNIRDMERIESFVNMSSMIKSSLEIINISKTM